MSETFVAIVGKSRKRFMLHTELAKRSSKFFEAAMSRDWKEAKEKEVVLEDVKEHHFEGYLQWLTTNEVTFVGTPRMAAMTKLYILGDFLGDLAFRNAVLDRIVRRACDDNVFPGFQSIQAAWEKTPAGCPLRKLFLDIWVAPIAVENRLAELRKYEDDYPKAFIIDYHEHLLAVHGPKKPFLNSEACKRMIEESRRSLTEQ